jgi:small-conductance mechanosensitive channel
MACRNFLRFFRIGDRVQYGRIKGDVTDIGLLKTTIIEIRQSVDGDLYNGNIVMIAYSYAFAEPVFNYSVVFPLFRDEIKIITTHQSRFRNFDTRLSEEPKIWYLEKKEK